MARTKGINIPPSCSSLKDFQNKRPYTGERKGFTLLEILIVVLILATVMSVVYLGFASATKVSSQIKVESQVYRSLRTAIHRIVEDLEALHTIPNSKYFLKTDKAIKVYLKVAESGDPEEPFLSFVADPLVAFGDEVTDKGPCLILYALRPWEGALLLTRGVVPLIPIFSKREDILLTNVKGIDITLVDKENMERKAWDTTTELQKDQLPKLINIKVTIDGKVFGYEDITLEASVAPKAWFPD